MKLERMLALREDATSHDDAAAPATTKLVGAAPVTCIKTLKKLEKIPVPHKKPITVITYRVCDHSRMMLGQSMTQDDNTLGDLLVLCTFGCQPGSSTRQAQGVPRAAWENTRNGVFLTGRGEERCPSGCHDPHSPLPIGDQLGRQTVEENTRKTTFNKHMLTKSLAFPRKNGTRRKREGCTCCTNFKRFRNDTR